jgi:hypothetical protein
MVSTPRRALVLLLLVTAALAAAGWWWARGAAGAGALHQLAPATARAGTSFEIKVLAGVWGKGREPAQRYAGWSLQLLRDGQPFGAALVPTRSGREGERVAVWFTATAPAALSSASSSGAPSLTWRLRFRFDGQAHEVAGPHPIAVLP